MTMVTKDDVKMLQLKKDLKKTLCEYYETKRFQLKKDIQKAVAGWRKRKAAEGRPAEMPKMMMSGAQMEKRIATINFGRWTDETMQELSAFLGSAEWNLVVCRHDIRAHADQGSKHWDGVPDLMLRIRYWY